MALPDATEELEVRVRWGATDWAWAAVLGVTATAGALLVWFANRPGRMSFDSSHQLRQVLREIPLDNWHPALMTWTWRLLYETTGSVGSMAALQILLGFGSALALALVLYEVTRSRLISFAAVAIMLLPNVINFIGVLWKDTQMMLTYFACAVALIAARKLPFLNRGVRVALMVAALGFLLYGTLVRSNALFAAIPLAVLLADTWRYRCESKPPEERIPLRLRRAAIAAIGFVALVVAATSAFSALAKPNDTSIISALYLDGIIFTVPAAEIRASDAPDELKDKLLEAQRECRENGFIVESYWKCYGRGATGKAFEPIAFREEVRDLWVGSVLTRPDRYLPYQAQVYAQFLATSRLFYQDQSVSQVPPEFRGGPNRADSILRTYVVDVGVDTLPWLFRAWFWLLVSVVFLMLSGRTLHFRFEIRALSCSALLYLLGYFVWAPTSDYRYSYWAAVANILAGLLFVVEGKLVGDLRRDTVAVGNPALDLDLPTKMDSDEVAEA